MLKMEGVGYRAPGSSTALLSDAELTVEPGEVRVVFGDSGTGKSTVLRLLAGLAMPDEGTVTALSRDLRRLRLASLRRMRRRIAVVDEVPRFLEKRSAFANVSLALEIAAQPRKRIRRAAADALARVGLGDRMDAPAFSLSRSDRLWLAVARALAREPEVLLADEPWRELDELGRDRLCNLLDELAADQATCLVTTGDHPMVELAELWGWGVTELRDGQLVAFHEVAPAHEIADEAADTATAIDLDVLGDMPGGLADVLPFPINASAGRA